MGYPVRLETFLAQNPHLLEEDYAFYAIEFNSKSETNDPHVVIHTT